MPAAKIPEKFQVSGFLVFFLLHSIQFGVGVLGFQRIIAIEAGHEAWMSVLLSGVVVNINIWMMYYVLKRVKGGMAEIHVSLLGKWIGNSLNLFFVLYFSALAVNVLRTYMEIVQVWMFPEINNWIYTALFLLLVWYTITGGFRVVTGISFFGVLLPSYLLITYLFPLRYSELNNLLPIFDHSVMEILKGTQQMSLTVLGIETLLVFFPFLKNPDKSQKWAHISVSYTTLLYLFIMIISTVYFSQEQLQKNIWATLTIWKIVEIPFVERFEYIGIANWNLVILPNICLALWCASRLFKSVTKIPQSKSLLGIILIVYVSMNFIETRLHINMMNDLMNKIGSVILYLYIPFLFTLSIVIPKIKEKLL
ncbi:GerAB/ArcD/ProY family transporter [Bacillus lacus]|uniref:GerAB/ArcD/ProY family transporter n=1 Tax=Metabacillus lacus TaxID=1983721 RepID=A0A7X2J025_9BACI|nr:GerAB/ArcD/ProY family transporter [Metabacillus lacus]MRX72283.1 GerAB/ArcD/ProY family transporter [Metabacillus lacus]